MRINPKATAALATVLLASSGGVAYAADSCPGMGGTSTTGTVSTTTTAGTTTTGDTTTTAATSNVARHQAKRHASRHAGRL